MEGHLAVGGCKDRVVTTKANALAWPELCAALTHDDVARDCGLTTEQLDAKTATC